MDGRRSHSRPDEQVESADMIEVRNVVAQVVLDEGANVVILSNIPCLNVTRTRVFRMIRNLQVFTDFLMVSSGMNNRFFGPALKTTQEVGA